MEHELLAAIRKQDVARVQSLLQQQPGLANLKTEDGLTPLHQATSAEIAQCLIDAGADIISFPGSANRRVPAVGAARKDVLPGAVTPQQRPATHDSTNENALMDVAAESNFPTIAATAVRNPRSFQNRRRSLLAGIGAVATLLAATGIGIVSNSGDNAQVLAPESNAARGEPATALENHRDNTTDPQSPLPSYEPVDLLRPGTV